MIVEFPIFGAGIIYFPTELSALRVFEPRYLLLIADAIKQRRNEGRERRNRDEILVGFRQFFQKMTTERIANFAEIFLESLRREKVFIYCVIHSVFIPLLTSSGVINRVGQQGVDNLLDVRLLSRLFDRRHSVQENLHLRVDRVLALQDRCR